MENIRITKVMRVGTSLAVVIPKDILRALNIERGDQMTFGVYSDDVICLRKMSADQLRQLKPRDVSHD